MSACRWPVEEAAYVAYFVHRHECDLQGEEAKPGFETEAVLMPRAQDCTDWEVFDSLWPQFWSSGVRC